jgi:hypothetical protein
MKVPQPASKMTLIHISASVVLILLIFTYSNAKSQINDDIFNKIMTYVQSIFPPGNSQPPNLYSPSGANNGSDSLSTMGRDPSMDPPPPPPPPWLKKPPK